MEEPRKVPTEVPEIEQPATYPEDTAGSLMQRSLVKVPDHWTVGQVVDYCREAKNLTDDIYDIFVVDRLGRLVGSLALGRMLRSARPAAIIDVLDSTIPSIPVTANHLEVANIFRDENLVTCPVVDERARLLGVIMVDDVVDIIDEQAEADLNAFESPSPTADAVEPQEIGGLNFRPADSNKIDLDRTAGVQGVLDTPSQRSLHAEVRSAGVRLREMFASNGSYSNQCPDLQRTVSAFLASLGSSLAELQPTLAVVRGNGLRIEFELDQRRQVAPDPDRQQMPEGLFALLQRLVETWNVYVSIDPYLEGMDAARLGPPDSFRPINRSAAAEALRSAGEFTTPAAIAEVQRIESQAQQTTNSGRRAERTLGATWRNLLRATFVVAISVGGAGYAIMKEAIPILRWINDHAEFIRQVLVDHPSMLSVLEWLLSRLPPL